MTSIPTVLRWTLRLAVSGCGVLAGCVITVTGASMSAQTDASLTDQFKGFVLVLTGIVLLHRSCSLWRSRPKPKTMFQHSMIQPRNPATKDTYVDPNEVRNIAVLNQLAETARTVGWFGTKPLWNTARSFFPDVDPGLGTHPELLERFWIEIAERLPVNCQCEVYGLPALANPANGVIFGFAHGTQVICLRVPAFSREYLRGAEIRSGHRALTARISAVTLPDEDWEFCCWGPMDAERCLSA